MTSTLELLMGSGNFWDIGGGDMVTLYQWPKLQACKHKEKSIGVKVVKTHRFCKILFPMKMH